jgi:hypothetical protein
MGKLSVEALPDEAREALTCLFNQIDDLGLRIHAMERRIIPWHRTSEVSQRLASAPGVGPITATALVAAVGDGKQFNSARPFAAWVGLTPGVQASVDKERIGRITKRGDRYLRTLLIHGARAVVGTTFRKTVTARPWLAALVNRRPVNVAANKTARALGSTQVNETMRATLSSSICLAVDPRKPSGPAAEWPNDKAGYTTASAGFHHLRSKTLARVGVVHTRRSARSGWADGTDDGSGRLAALNCRATDHSAMRKSRT